MSEALGDPEMPKNKSRNEPLAGNRGCWSLIRGNRREAICECKASFPGPLLAQDVNLQNSRKRRL